MKYKIKSIFVSLLLSTGLTSLGQEKVTTYVNLFIGTGAVESSLSGNNYPGATVPFGMVQLSPEHGLLPIGEKPAVTTITTKSLSVSATPV